MTYYFDDIVTQCGTKSENSYYGREGTYITPDGLLFDVDGYARVAHAGGFVIPFFMNYTEPEREDISFFTKSEIVDNLISWREALQTTKYDVLPKEQQMRLELVKYLINVYKSKYAIWDDINRYVDLSNVTGIPNGTENLFGRDRFLKDVLVQACNYDSVESQLYRAITTSKFNIYETFYDYMLHDYRIFQIPKMVYDDNLEKYVFWSQPDWMITERELRLKDEVESIRRMVPLNERGQYCRNKIKVNSYDFLH